MFATVRRFRWPVCAMLVTSAVWAQTPRSSRAELRDTAKATAGRQALKVARDHLPTDWTREATGANPVDSHGDPIVNDPPALPGWSQRDIAGLRAAIARQVGRPPAYTAQEQEWVLGNYLGQAFVRGVRVDDLLDLQNQAVVNDDVVASVAGYLASYEQRKQEALAERGAAYAPTTYTAEVYGLLEAYGYDPAELAAGDADVNVPAPVGVRGGDNCMGSVPFTGDITLLSDETLIWDDMTTADDEFADVPIGFPNFIFYYCEDPDTNDQVRVSTNGYITFFEQGGDAVVGSGFTNDPIPDTLAPDGFAAPWWDDLIVDEDNGDFVGYKTEGAVGERVFTVQWSSVSHFGVSEVNFYWFQVKLYEHDDEIEFIYGLWNGSGDADNATIGIEAYSGTQGVCGPNCSDSNGTDPPANYRFFPTRPSNNFCFAATALLIRAQITGSLINASQNGGTTCGFNAGRDVWYSFTAPCDGTFTANTCGTNDTPAQDTGMDTVLSLHSACTGGEPQLSCNDDFIGCANAAGLPLDSRVQAAVAADETVYLRVSHYDDGLADGEFQLHTSFEPDEPIANDTCANAEPVVDGALVIADLTCASASDATGCPAFGVNRDAWYRFTADESGLLRVSTCGTHEAPGPDAGMDTYLAVYDQCNAGDPADLLACNDDTGDCGVADSGLLRDSLVEVSLTAGQTVYIGVSHFGTDIADGQFTLQVDFDTGCPNDPTGTACDSDLDGDCIINNNDLGVILAAYLSTDGEARYNPAADLSPLDSPDGVINNNDLAEVLADYLNNCN